MAFLISISGAGVPAAETTIDHAQREMTVSGMPPGTVAARMGRAPDTFPGSPDHPQFQIIRRSYLYDPAPTLHQLQLPVLALFGELDKRTFRLLRTGWPNASGGSESLANLQPPRL